MVTLAGGYAIDRHKRSNTGTGPAMGASAGSSSSWLCSRHEDVLFQGGVTYTYDTNYFPVRDRNLTTLESCQEFCEALPRDRYMGFFDSNAKDCYVFTNTGSRSCEGHACENIDVDFHSSDNVVVFLQCGHEVVPGMGGEPYVHHNDKCCNSQGHGGGVIYLATNMLEVRGRIEARGGHGGDGEDAKNLENSSYVFVDAPSDEFTTQDLRDVCNAHGFGWDIVSIESVDQVRSVDVRA